MPAGPSSDLESEIARLREENAKLKEELLSLKTTVSAVVARSIDARADTGRRRRTDGGESNKVATRGEDSHRDGVP
jgi:hypothetical protein